MQRVNFAVTIANALATISVAASKLEDGSSGLKALDAVVSALVRPGEDFVTRIPCSFIDLPADLNQRLPKHLEFAAMAYSCRRN
jgi:hypothetical protein